MDNEALLLTLDEQIGARTAALDEAGIDVAALRARAVEHASRDTEDTAPRLLALVVFSSSLHDLLVEQGLDDSAAVDVVGRIVRGPWVDDPAVLRRWLAMRYGVDPSAPAAAWEEAAVQFKKRGEAVFGREIVYEQERLDDEASWVNITHCFINDFLRSLGKAELVRVFCALDNVIAAEFDRVPEYGITFRQVTTQGQGSDKCRFHFTRVDVTN